jgi:hypothetical protein
MLAVDNHVQVLAAAQDRSMNQHTLAQPDSPPRVLKCKTTADFLAALPQLAGFTADDSLFIVFFSGKRAGSAARVDLPPSEDTAVMKPFLDFISSILKKAGAAGNAAAAPALVITTTRTFAESGGAPWRRLARRLEHRLSRDRIRLRELCCQAPDGWANYSESAAFATGHPLSEIAESPIALEALTRGEVPPDLSELGVFPVPDPEKTAALQAELKALAPFPAHRPGTSTPPIPLTANDAESARPVKSLPAWFAETAEVTRALRDETKPLSVNMKARLIRSAAHPDRWLLVTLGILTRPEFPCELAQDMSPESFTGVAVDLDANEHEKPLPGWSVRRMMNAICYDFHDRARLPLIRDRLLTLVSETPQAERPGLLALSAWVWWLSGTQTVSHRHIEEALELDPAHELTQMVKRLIESTLYSRWLESSHVA